VVVALAVVTVPLWLHKHAIFSVAEESTPVVPDGYPAYCASALKPDGVARASVGVNAVRHTKGAITRPVLALVEAAKKPLSLSNEDSAVAETHTVLKLSRILEPASSYPEEAYSGRGVVIVGGGVKYTPPAYACVHFLRKAGCTLPIEVWLPPSEPVPEIVANEFTPLGATVRQLADEFPEGTLTGVKKFVYKPAAILASSFSEVFLLDADNLPIQDPSYLFDHPLYSAHGLLMWQDFWPCQAQNKTWELLGIPENRRPLGSHESGQMIVDKRRGWQPLLLSLYLNLRGDIFYSMFSEIGQGDKETYPFAWLALNQTYGLVPFGVYALGYIESGEHRGTAMLQRGPDGSALFVHAHMPKVDLRVEDHFEKRNWNVLTGKISVIPSGTQRSAWGDYRLLNAAAGYDMELELHHLRQMLRCKRIWVDFALNHTVTGKL
jgi:alpha 1,2-mannosyltransferase